MEYVDVRSSDRVSPAVFQWSSQLFHFKRAGRLKRAIQESQPSESTLTGVSPHSQPSPDTARRPRRARAARKLALCGDKVAAMWVDGEVP